MATFVFWSDFVTYLQQPGHSESPISVAHPSSPVALLRSALKPRVTSWPLVHINPQVLRYFGFLFFCLPFSPRDVTHHQLCPRVDPLATCLLYVNFQPWQQSLQPIRASVPVSTTSRLLHKRKKKKKKLYNSCCPV